MVKKTGKRILWIVAALAAVGVALALFFTNFVWAAGGFYPRFREIVDLRGKELTVSEFSELRQKIPDSVILWDVPFQGQRISSNNTELTVSSLTEADLEMLEYFPNLRQVDATGCEDYDALALLRERMPECGILYQVPLSGQRFGQDATSLSLTDASAQELEWYLPYLPKVTEVKLTGRLPEKEALDRLQGSFPGIRFSWKVILDGSPVESTLREADLAGRTLDYEALRTALSYLPQLEKADLRGCSLTDSQIKTLAQENPNCFFLWNIHIGELVFPTDVEEMDISGQKMESAEEIESILPLLPNLKKVIMSFCGLDDETMDALNRRHEDIRFIWSVKIKNVYLRTDAKFFYPYTFYHSMQVNSQDIYPLRYCTDIEAIDIGHMVTVDNCEWAAFMPNLKYLIIIETKITDISPLANAKNLRFLEIFSTKITDYTPLLGCTSLEDLNLGKTYGDPTPIAKMTWLKNVWWFGAPERGKASSNAVEMLTEALPNTTLRFWLTNPNVRNGWRDLDNYHAMRDLMGVPSFK